MTVIFDGKAFAQVKIKDLKSRVGELRKNGIVPKLISIIVGDNPASALYVNLKKEAGLKAGCEVTIVSYPSSTKKGHIVESIEKYNRDSKVHGIMVQLPLPKDFSLADRDEIVSSIAKEKDVDGLRKDSIFIAPVVKAVLEILREASSYLPSDKAARVVVVGAGGFEGNKIVNVLSDMDYDVEGVDKGTTNLKSKISGADVVISVTGSPGIIGKNEVKENAIVIDVGSPKGDVQKEEMDKAAFLSPVPGGVGPITIVSLLENLLVASE